MTGNCEIARILDDATYIEHSQIGYLGVSTVCAIRERTNIIFSDMCRSKKGAKKGGSVRVSLPLGEK